MVQLERGPSTLDNTTMKNSQMWDPKEGKQ